MNADQLWQEEVQSQLTKIEGHLAERNGTIFRLQEEMFGSKEHGTTGVKEDVNTLKVWVVQAKTVVKIVIAVIAFFGITNILILLRAAEVVP